MRAPPRQFSLFDAMVMVAATAIGLVGSSSLYGFEAGTSLGTGSELWLNGLSLIRPCLISWCLALSLIALKRPRPTIRRVARQPGVVGCWAATIALAATIFIEWAKLTWYRCPFDLGDAAFYSSNRPMGCSVLSIWVIAKLSGRWRPEPNWIDRMGRLLGMIFILAMPFDSSVDCTPGLG